MSDPFPLYSYTPQAHQHQQQQQQQQQQPALQTTFQQSGSPSANDSTPHSPQERKSSGANGVSSAPAQAQGLNARSCVTCRKRKVRCDKKIPCSNCEKAHQQCVFPAPGRAPRRPRQGTAKVVTEREAELLKRLRRLEGVVEELSGQVDTQKHSPGSDHSSPQHRDGDSATESGKSVRVVGMDEGTGTKKNWINRSFNLGTGPPKTAFKMEGALGRLTLDEGKSQYYSNPFWASITDEVEELREIVEDHDFESDEEAPILPSDVITEAQHQSFIMGYSSSDVNLRSLHPLPSQLPFYWQTYLENVNPLVKILHTSTMNKVIKEVQSNLDTLSPSTEALMFSIYFATITSMNNDEVRANFGVDKDYMLKQYRFGVEQALARAGFLNTKEIVTIQAFVLFLVCVRRHDDTRFVWSLTGLAIRIAQSLGLHRDGGKFGLSPFDTEMRRRLWWQVCILDVRASEDHGTDPSIIEQSFDTEQPLNINDADLDPNSAEYPVSRKGITEMTFCLIRYEICTLSRKLSYIPPGLESHSIINQTMTLEDKEALIKDTADLLEDRYLQYCEDGGPLYWVAATVARLITAKMSLLIYHPLTQPGTPNTLSQSIKDRLFMASIEILEYSQVLEHEATTKQWGWLFHTYVQWHAIAYILGELSTRPPSVIVDRAWRAMDSAFYGWDGDAFKSKSGMLWQPIRKLMARARKKRQENVSLGYQANQSLGIDRSHFRPPPTGPDQGVGAIAGISAEIARDRVKSLTTSPTSLNDNQLADQSNGAGVSFLDSSSYNMDMMQPQIVGMGPNYAPDQIQFKLQQQQQQQASPWSMNDNSLLDLDMQGLEGDNRWDGWEDVVKDFKMSETDMQLGTGDFRRPAFGTTMGTWW